MSLLDTQSKSLSKQALISPQSCHRYLQGRGDTRTLQRVNMCLEDKTCTTLRLAEPMSQLYMIKEQSKFEKKEDLLIQRLCS